MKRVEGGQVSERIHSQGKCCFILSVEVSNFLQDVLVLKSKSPCLLVTFIGLNSASPCVRGCHSQNSHPSPDFRVEVI